MSEDILNHIDECWIDNPRIYVTDEAWLGLNAYDIIEGNSDELHQDALDFINESKIKELQEYLDKFCEDVKNDTYSYSPNLAIGVYLNKEEN